MEMYPQYGPNMCNVQDKKFLLKFEKLHQWINFYRGCCTYLGHTTQYVQCAVCTALKGKRALKKLVKVLSYIWLGLSRMYFYLGGVYALIAAHVANLVVVMEII